MAVGNGIAKNCYCVTEYKEFELWPSAIFTENL